MGIYLKINLSAYSSAQNNCLRLTKCSLQVELINDEKHNFKKIILLDSRAQFLYVGIFPQIRHFNCNSAQNDLLRLIE